MSYVKMASESAGLLEDDEIETENGNLEGKIQTPSSATYEEALQQTGFGRFNIMLLVLCGWAQISDSVEILSVSFLLPVASDSMNLSDLQKGILNSVIFVGMMLGGYIWGSLADVQGRKRVLVYSLAMNAFFGLSSSFAQSFWLFLMCRFFSGVGVGGTIPVVFSYFGEFQQRDYRGAMISALSTCWMFGNILTAGLAWLIIPSDIGFINHDKDKFSYQSWRVFIAVCIFPAATSAITFIYLPESPKFLLETGQEEKALAVLRKIYIKNKKHVTSTEYSIEHLIANTKVHRKSSLPVHGRMESKFFQILSTSSKLFRVPVLRNTLAILLIAYSLSFGYYGLWMWFPQIFAQLEYGNGTVCSSDIVDVPDDGNSSAIYQDAFLTALSNLPGNLFTIAFMDRLGRRFLMATSLLLSGISVFFIWFVSSRTQVLITSLCFGGASVIAWNTLNVLGVELFPTPLRSTALGVQSMLNRFGAICGNLMFGILIHLHCSIPLLTVALLLAVAGVVTFTLPNTTREALQ